MIKYLRYLATNKPFIFIESFKFISVGILNTLLTITIYQICLFFVAHAISYAISWAVGLIFVILFYPAAVFQQKSTSYNKKLLVGVLYFLVFIFCSVILEIIVSHGINNRLAIFIVFVFSTIFNFFGMRFILRFCRIK